MTFRHILAATDFGECSRTAIEHAIDIATRYGAKLTVVHTFQPPVDYGTPLFADIVTPLQEAAEAQMEELLEPVRGRCPNVTGIVRFGLAWEQILDVAHDQGADLIVVGSHGRKGLPRALLGSVSEKVVRLSPVPVLTVGGRGSAA
jgi:nucleotide-binding universal stress UspA family protein